RGRFQRLVPRKRLCHLGSRPSPPRRAGRGSSASLQKLALHRLVRPRVAPPTWPTARDGHTGTADGRRRAMTGVLDLESRDLPFSVALAGMIGLAKAFF